MIYFPFIWMGTFEKDYKDYTIKQGNTKYISGSDSQGYVFKVFKTRGKILPIEKQRKIIEMKKKYFGEYIPETLLCEFGNGEYYIKQKYIKGKTLAETDISCLSAETLRKLIDLIKKYLKYYKEQGGEMDITGYQYYTGNPGKLERKIRNFLKIYKNFLSSTNIMVGDDGNVYVVDVCESTDSRLQGKIKNFCAKPFIMSTINQLHKLLQQKILFENKENNLFNAMNS